ncbi:MAG: SBBP repeat-containing protein [Bacteroidetes bacterium]|nr:SBBP repeat-containing protein [Bacteroidota bacterium]
MWARNFSGADYETAFSVAADISGNVFVTGSFDGTSDFDPGSGVNNLTSAGFQDIFVVKLNASGNFVWAHQLGSVADDYGNSVAVDATGNLYLAGYFQTTVDFNPGAGTNALTSFVKMTFLLPNLTLQVILFGSIEWVVMNLIMPTLLMLMQPEIFTQPEVLETLLILIREQV